MAASPGESRARPATSRCAPLRGVVGCKPRHASRRPATPKGRLTQKIQCQERWLRIRPPTSGPRIGPSSPGRLTSDIIRPSLRSPAALTSRV